MALSESSSEVIRICRLQAGLRQTYKLVIGFVALADFFDSSTSIGSPLRLHTPRIQLHCMHGDYQSRGICWRFQSFRVEGPTPPKEGFPMCCGENQKRPELERPVRDAIPLRGDFSWNRRGRSASRPERRSRNVIESASARNDSNHRVSQEIQWSYRQTGKMGLTILGPYNIE
jgi:hypothetical protein